MRGLQTYKFIGLSKNKINVGRRLITSTNLGKLSIKIKQNTL